MHTRTLLLRSVLAALMLVLGLAPGCAPRHLEPAPADAGISLAVAPFNQPTTSRQALAGYISDTETVNAKTLASLDSALAQELLTTSRAYKGTSLTRPCMEPALGEFKNPKAKALDYWVEVGRCAATDYLLVPQVISWHEREGGPAGVTKPASVVIDFYVVHVPEHSVTARYRYDETQVSLTDNLLTLPRFLQRGAKWVTAEDLARYGISQALGRVGLK